MTPISSQVLTVYYGNIPVNITLDSGATTNFISLKKCRSLKVRMLKNGQTVKLGDGCTTLAACGEVSITFTRDKWSVKFEGIVVEKLNCDLYGGMTFHVDNDISVRPKTGEIKVLNKYVVYQTNLLMLPPQVKSMELKSTIVAPAKTILFPKPKIYWSEHIQTKANPSYEGSSLRLELPVGFQNEKFVGIQPRMENKLDS